MGPPRMTGVWKISRASAQQDPWLGHPLLRWRGTERQCTVITSTFGPLQGRRIVRSREAECTSFYHTTR
ncbi:MAG: hypothetical protein ACYC67_26130 [Prosthecobacter sp.]